MTTSGVDDRQAALLGHRLITLIRADSEILGVIAAGSGNFQGGDQGTLDNTQESLKSLTDAQAAELGHAVYSVISGPVRPIIPAS